MAFQLAQAFVTIQARGLSDVVRAVDRTETAWKRVGQTMQNVRTIQAQLNAQASEDARKSASVAQMLAEKLTKVQQRVHAATSRAQATQSAGQEAVNRATQRTQTAWQRVGQAMEDVRKLQAKIDEHATAGTSQSAAAAMLAEKLTKAQQRAHAATIRAKATETRGTSDMTRAVKQVQTGWQRVAQAMETVRKVQAQIDAHASAGTMPSAATQALQQKLAEAQKRVTTTTGEASSTAAWGRATMAIAGVSAGLAVLQAGIGLVIRGLDQLVSWVAQTVSQLNRLGIAAGAALATGTAAIGKFVNDFEDYTDAVRNLGNTLEIVGGGAAGTLEHMKAFAEAIRAQTPLTDTAVLGLERMALSTGIFAKNVESATRMAIGLAESYGMSQEESLELVQRALNGEFHALERRIPILRTIGGDQQKLNKLNELGAKGMEQLARESKTFHGQLTILRRTVMEAGRSLGAMFAPIVEEKIKIVTSYIKVLKDKIAALTPEQRENIVRWTLTAGAIAGVLALLPGVVAALGLVASTILAIATNPLSLLLVGLAGLAGWFLYTSTAGETLSEKLKTIWDDPKAALGKFVSFVKLFWQAIKAEFKVGALQVKELLKGMAESLLGPIGAQLLFQLPAGVKFLKDHPNIRRLLMPGTDLAGLIPGPGGNDPALAKAKAERDQLFQQLGGQLNLGGIGQAIGGAGGGIANLVGGLSSQLKDFRAKADEIANNAGMAAAMTGPAPERQFPRRDSATVGITALMNRIQEAAFNQGGGVPEKQLEVLKEIREALKKQPLAIPLVPAIVGL